MTIPAGAVEPHAVTVVLDKLLPPDMRTYIYVAVFFVVPILGIVGWLTDSQVQRITWFTALVLGFGSTGLAVTNRPHEATVTGPVILEDGTEVPYESLGGDPA